MSTATTKEGTENYSHPGRPGHDELVPSRYALRVGEIDVMVISDGGCRCLWRNKWPCARAKRRA